MAFDPAVAGLAALRNLLAPDALYVGAEIGPRYRGDWMVQAAPDAEPLALALPRTTDEVSGILRICDAHAVPVVPQGGLTGLTGGGTPVRGAVLVSLERMHGVEELDPIASTITVQAGVPLQAVQEAADAAGLLFPLDIGGRGSCLIGGNISTNAGGNRVLRYGMMRDLVLGLEVALADGTVLTSLNKMLKNNAGYDLKQLFVGSEGTLGIVTRAVLRLQPKPASVGTALCAFTSFASVTAFLQHVRGALGPFLSAFEVMWPDFYTMAAATRGGTAPLPVGAAAYVLIESMGTDAARDPARFSAAIEQALEEGIVSDAVVAQSIADAGRLWAIRDASGELVQSLQPLANYDVSIETGRIDEFARACRERLKARWPAARTICFGHLADSNLHMFVTVGETPFPEHDIDDVVYGAVRDWGGSISAEHGIGLLKRRFLGHSRTSAEIALMRRLKAALDPNGILNPQKVFA